MRDTYVFLVFSLLILVCGVLVYMRVADAGITLVPLITGFLGLLGKIEKSPPTGSITLSRSLWPWSKAPPTMRGLSPTDPPQAEDKEDKS